MDLLINARGEDLVASKPLIDRQEKLKSPTINGWRHQVIRRLIWLNIVWIALLKFRNPIKAIKVIRALREVRKKYRPKPLIKSAKSNGRYFLNYVTPGWPSVTFNRYISHMLGKATGGGDSLATIIFAITKKCGFKCEHCFEWFNLNQPETLSREDLLLILYRFHKLGISQVQLSGGEPLNRINDIYSLLQNGPAGIDYWLYSTGYSLSPEKAKRLKEAGLTGIAISLDHHDPVKHNKFRGVKDAFERAMDATRMARNEGLLVCYSLCATNEFISLENLIKYADLAAENGVSFIQLLEPRAVGHYTGKEVGLNKENIQLLESFFETMNFDPAYKNHPSVVYHGYYSRRVGCSGSGVDYLYIDTDGDIHNCPFCQHKHFSAFDDELPSLLQAMKGGGCHSFASRSPILDQKS